MVVLALARKGASWVELYEECFLFLAFRFDSVGLCNGSCCPRSAGLGRGAMNHVHVLWH